MLVVFGIGNPGPEYRHTRHNVGFAVIHAIAQEALAAIVPIRGVAAEGARVRIGGATILLVKPLTYVNRCGPVLKHVCDRLAIPLSESLTVVDDLNLPVGRLRMRAGGSDGGHNGLKSLREHLGSPEHPRLRIGIGSPEPRQPVSDFVLERFAEDELAAMRGSLQRAVRAVALWASLGLTRALPEVNRRDPGHRS